MGTVWNSSEWRFNNWWSKCSSKIIFKNKYTWNLLDFLNYRHRVVLFGVGWWQYQKPSNI